MASSALEESSSKELTILLLGETGVGKSTWINGFANFILFPDFASAEANPLHCIVPSSFTIADENYQSRSVTVSQDINEVMDPGQSATQQPQSYVFNRNGYKVRLIDTPGIGDVRGVKQDKKNFERILDHISHLDSLHAICILLKPNNARLNIMFRFCIQELLKHLHKDACANIIFCFTNSRSTFYRPGDTLPPLTKLLEENKNISIPLDRSTIFCMDNEAIRFLYATKNGITFSQEERENYAKSWDQSVKEINRLLDRADKSSPHPVHSTLSINTARQTILALGSPMAEVTRIIQLNIATQQAQFESVKNSEKSQEELARNLVHKLYEIRMHHLPEPRTVCTAVKCVEHLEVGGIKETNYNSYCHANCGTGKEKHFKIVNIVGHKNLKKCSAFKSDGSCKRCNCSWKVHMKITYETSLVEKEVADVEKQMELKYQENCIQKIEAYLYHIGLYIDELKQEQAEITDASVKFAKFLRVNSITPYNDAMDEYIGLFISDERNKLGTPGGGNPSVLDALIKMQANYKKEMEILNEAMKQESVGPPLSPQELDQLIQTLYGMKHNGQMLKEMMETSQSSADSCYTEKVVGRNAECTTVTKRPRKKGKLLHEFVQWINPEKRGNSSPHSASQIPTGRRENSSVRNDQPELRVKVMVDYPANQQMPLQTRPTPPIKPHPPPPPSKPHPPPPPSKPHPPPPPLKSQPTPPSSPRDDSGNDDHSDTEASGGRASLLQDIRRGMELRKIDMAEQARNRANIPPTQGNVDLTDLLQRSFAKFQDDDEWN